MSASFKDLEVRRQRALEEAAAWLVRLQSNMLTASDRSALADWLRESPLHVSAMLRVSHTDHALSSFDDWDSIPVDASAIDDAVIEWPSVPPAPKRPMERVVVTRRRLVAAALALVLMAGSTAELLWQNIIAASTFRTTTGERRDVALEDGSTLRLGPQTQVRVRFTHDQRSVTLEQGEAVFKVAKDPTRPFYVDADRARVRAVGTEFGVEKRAEAVVVTVAEGRVAVSPNSSSVLSSPADSAGAGVIALAAGDQLSVPSSGARHSAVRKVNSADSLAWASGRLVFADESLATVIERFNQYNSVQLRLSDPQLAQRRITGSFDATDLESLLGFLHSAVPVEAERLADGREIRLAPQHGDGDP